MKRPVTASRASLGFSLVEVTIAMGIVATVLIALLALLPYGMDNVREAKATLVQSRIANEIVGELQVAEWGKAPGYSKLKNYDKAIRRYDGEGTQIREKSESNNQDTIFKARIEVNVDEPAHLPGQAGTSQGVFLRKVTVKIAYAPGDKEVDWEAKKVPLPYKTFTTEIVNMARADFNK